ncbi:hypothetical protein A6F68_01786 [Tsuneonella dongtanensis]|uniref:VanZ like family protein n=1 Tax=Tsuneonella dongtanensis TaxID=692370 RepID=A0A1B2ADS1_9SPHN|nr:hypothetical protein [Tsuneonella dongtanensis]ANY20296.1 hypothetical protein A6F68_01786 [Tsuneonella dongtanensis]
MALIPRSPTIPIEQGDKVMHMLAFFTLGGLAAAGWRASPALLLFASLGIFGGAIEVFQAIPALHRDADWYDWIADMGAAALAIAAVRIVLPRQ